MDFTLIVPYSRTVISIFFNSLLIFSNSEILFIYLLSYLFTGFIKHLEHALPGEHVGWGWIHGVNQTGIITR